MYTKNNNNAFTCHMDKYGLSWGKVEGFAGWEFTGMKFARETFTGWEFTCWELERVGILKVGIDRRDSLGGSSVYLTKRTFLRYKTNILFLAFIFRFQKIHLGY